MSEICRKQLVTASAVFAAIAVFADYKDGMLWSFEAKQGEADGTFDAAKFVDEVSAGTANPLTLTFNYDDPDACPYFTNVTVKSGPQVLTSAPEYLK